MLHTRRLPDSVATHTCNLRSVPWHAAAATVSGGLASWPQPGTSSLAPPTQVPDVDAVIHFQDLPIADLDHYAKSAPVFAYAGGSSFVDVPFPDWAFWGNMGHNQPASWQVRAFSGFCWFACWACGRRCYTLGYQQEARAARRLQMLPPLYAGIAVCDTTVHTHGFCSTCLWCIDDLCCCIFLTN